MAKSTRRCDCCRRPLPIHRETGLHFGLTERGGSTPKYCLEWPKCKPKPFDNRKARKP